MAQQIQAVEVLWFGKEVEFRTLEMAKEALQKTGEMLLEKANETVPKDLGNLEEAGKVFVRGESLADANVKISYREPYAMAQHEDTEQHHQGAGRAKWLQLTMREQAGEAKLMLAEGIKV